MKYTKEFAEKFLELCPWANAVAVDMDGKCFWYKGTPKCELMENLEYNWGIDLSNNNAKGFIGYFDADIDWKDTLVTRTWKPKIGENYYVPNPLGESMFSVFSFTHDRFDLLKVEREIAFKTQEEAVLCAKKMLEAIK